MVESHVLLLLLLVLLLLLQLLLLLLLLLAVADRAYYHSISTFVSLPQYCQYVYVDTL